MLKVYNWADYIGEGVLEDFQEYYKEQTGEDIRIVYQTFDINEIMLTKIEKGVYYRAHAAQRLVAAY